MATTTPAVRLKGYREFQRALSLTPRQVKKELRQPFREAGEIVRVEATSRFEDFSAKTARGFRTVVRARGVGIEQSLRKTTGLRSDWGAKQMRSGLLPAYDDKRDEVVEKVDEALEGVVNYFELVSRWQGSGLVGTLS